MNTVNVNLTEIESQKNAIDTVCIDMLYHPFADYQNFGWKIFYATKILYHNILRIYRKQSPFNIANLNSLTLQQNLELLTHIEVILNTQIPISDKETYILNLFNKHNLVTDQLLLNPNIYSNENDL